ncbi:hypothetical protein SAMN04488104_100976 [Algoriphagus faecimaris]|uniref:Uncharacterized protein n=1 Tax=Algoriphagus faecimaris TaxID=686796 RepID=A0A1G6QJ92_9BACT|nr:hypothetical protein SAMN04488104_100976 [Algoriphagus faecimaris]
MEKEIPYKLIVSGSGPSHLNRHVQPSFGLQFVLNQAFFLSLIEFPQGTVSTAFAFGR